jgi:phage shock protein PspC (stress-responsive transcriptional regulator)
MSGSVLTREDTLLGACYALGEDFGFNPTWLRAAFALGLFLSPVAAIAGYAGCAVLVLVSRLVAPDPARPETEAEEPSAAEAPAPEWQDELPLAA